MPTRRELFLQNRLAMASVLLFRCTRVLGRDPQSQSLLIECEDYFQETREQIRREIQSFEPDTEPKLEALPQPPPTWTPPKPETKTLFAQRILTVLKEHAK
jgi:hypothetical protein